EKTRVLLGGEAPAREISVDEDAQVALLNGRRVELTAQEMALLLALMNQPDTPVSREQLLREAWGYQSMGETRTVDVHVQRLRKKLGEDWIETVYKCGYRLRLA
ncbi:MAG: winged helix-turn-helix domain-containing protein, partial [Candidatus Limiplasma sp.]|nr:winged helix-turn-helix domain-containing protein [Candidatus Limiplasma sp.]